VRLDGAVEVDSFKDFISKYQAAEEKKNEHPDRNFYLSFISTILIAVYAGLTLILVCSSLKSNKIAVDSMHQSQRPWIGPFRQIPLVTGPIIIDGRGMIRVDYRMSAVNYGSFGANNVMFWAQLYVAQDITTIYDRSKDACTSSTSNPQMGRVLFPGQIRAWSTLGQLLPWT